MRVQVDGYLKLRVTISRLGVVYSCHEVKDSAEIEDYEIGKLYETESENATRMLEIVTHKHNFTFIHSFFAEHFSYIAIRPLFDQLVETSEKFIGPQHVQQA